MATVTEAPAYPVNYFQERKEYRRHAVERAFGNGAINYISKFADMADPGTEVMATSEPFNVEAINGRSLRSLTSSA